MTKFDWASSITHWNERGTASSATAAIEPSTESSLRMPRRDGLRILEWTVCRREMCESTFRDEISRLLPHARPCGFSSDAEF